MSPTCSPAEPEGGLVSAGLLEDSAVPCLMVTSASEILALWNPHHIPQGRFISLITEGSKSKCHHYTPHDGWILESIPRTKWYTNCPCEKQIWTQNHRGLVILSFSVILLALPMISSSSSHPKMDLYARKYLD